jgi:hypothetical protein
MKTLLATLLVGGALLVSSAKALTVYAITQNNHLITFDSATPGTVVNDDAITGINNQYSVVGIAIRSTVQPGSSNAGVGSLWGIAYNGTDFFLCTINPATGVATQVGGTLLLDDSANADAFGFGFDPAADRFRFISVQTNYAINPNTATFVQQTSFAGNPAHSGAAFTPSPYTGGTSRFYNINRDVNPRILQTSANIASGVLTQVGSGNLGTLSPPAGLAFGGSTLFMAADGSLFTVNTTTGSATTVGMIGGNPTIRGLAIVPAAFPPTTAISVKISGKKIIHTPAASRVVRGTVKSNAGVDSVEYRVGTKGKFRKAKGTTKWSFTARLKPGRNNIFVRAKIGTVVSKIAKVTIIRD